jgi:hypothetical protein
MVNSLYVESKQIAQEAWQECKGDVEDARIYVSESCDSHEVAIYTYKALMFCANNDTSAGESFLEDCGGIVQNGDNFGAIACRIAYATLYVAAMAELDEIEKES